MTIRELAEQLQKATVALEAHVLDQQIESMEGCFGGDEFEFQCLALKTEGPPSRWLLVFDDRVPIEERRAISDGFRDADRVLAFPTPRGGY